MPLSARVCISRRFVSKSLIKLLFQLIYYYNSVRISVKQSKKWSSKCHTVRLYVYYLCIYIYNNVCKTLINSCTYSETAVIRKVLDENLDNPEKLFNTFQRVAKSFSESFQFNQFTFSTRVRSASNDCSWSVIDIDTENDLSVFCCLIPIKWERIGFCFS